MLKIITKKNNIVDILIYPVLVQGPSAPADIANAINDINSEYNDVDIIITGRGGGSTEELWAFNEEVVARSIFASKIPVISAVGHETDFTIADFVADLRAETPTAAAERAVPDIQELKEYVEALHIESKRNLKMMLEYKNKQLQLLDPTMFSRDIMSRIAMDSMRIDNIKEAMVELLNKMITDNKHKLSILKETIDGANPKSILKRGYSMVTDEYGKIIKDASLLKENQLINIEAASGKAQARVVASGKEQ